MQAKVATHRSIQPSNININSGIELVGACMPSIKRHQNWRAVRQRTAEGTNIPNTLFTAVENEPITAEYMLCNQPLPPEKD